MPHLIKILGIFAFSLHFSSLYGAELEEDWYEYEEDSSTVKVSKSLPQKYQDILIEKGYDIFKAITHNEIKSLSPALSLINSIPSEIKEKTAFNTYAQHAPTAYWRWYREKDNITFQEYLAQIICLMWAVDDMAIRQQEGFKRGSFTLIDPDYRIFNFLKTYVCLVNDVKKVDDLPYLITSSNLAYRRDPASSCTSHHTDQTDGPQYGIDIRFRGYETIYGLLPHCRRHILCGKLFITSSNLPLTFLKFESAGLGSSMEMAYHTISFMKPVSSKGDKRREKDIPYEIRRVFKELVPYEDRVDELKIHEILDHVHFRMGKNYQDKVRMLNVVQQHYLKDPESLLFIRTGNEVILDLRDIKLQEKEEKKNS